MNGPLQNRSTALTGNVHALVNVTCHDIHNVVHLRHETNSATQRWQTIKATNLILPEGSSCQDAVHYIPDIGQAHGSHEIDESTLKLRCHPCSQLDRNKTKAQSAQSLESFKLQQMQSNPRKDIVAHNTCHECGLTANDGTKICPALCHAT